MAIEKPLYMGYVKAMFNAMGFLCISIGTLFLFGTAPLLKFIPFLVLAFAMMTYPTQSVSNEEEIGLGMMKMLLGVIMVVIFAFFTFIDLLTMQPLLWISLSAIAAGFFISIPVLEVKGDDLGANVMKKMQKTFSKAGEALGGGIMEKVEKGKRGAFLGKMIKIFIILIIIFIIFSVCSELLFSFGLPDYSIGSTSMTIAPILGLMLCVFSVFMGFKLREKMNTVNPMLLGICGGIGLFAGSIALMHDIVSFIVFALVVGFGILVSMPVDKAKPLLGIPILLIALATTTIAYPDVMGEAVFGIWWPTIDYNIESTIGPLIQGFQSPMGTLGQGYECLVNPQQCYVDYQPTTSTKESIRSVEVTNIDPIGIGKIDERTDEFMVIATVENRGKEDARNIRLIPKKPILAHGIEGEDEVIVGSVEIRCPDGSVSSGDNPQCTVDKLITGEIRELVLNYFINQGRLDPGNYVSTGLDIEYETEIMGQVDVMVMDNDYYLKLSKNNKLGRSEQVTEDTGGPVRLGLALMRNQMPVRDNLQGVPVMLYLDNQGPGVVERIIDAEVDINDLEAGKSCTPGGPGDYDLEGLGDLYEPDLKKEVDNDYKLKSREHVSGTCISIVPDIQVEQKTFALNGRVVYTYSHGRERKIPIEFISDTEGGGTTGGGVSAEEGCEDTDGGLNYFTAGTTTESGGGTGTASQCYIVYDDDEHRFESCENWCQNYVNGEGGMVCDPYSDCSSVDDSPVEWDCTYGGSAKGNEGADCADIPTQDPRIKNCRLIRCGCMEENGGRDTEEYTDECDSDTGTVTEWYCDGDTAASKTYVCPLGCGDGACIGGLYEITWDGGKCEDYEGGKNYFKAGKVCFESFGWPYDCIEEDQYCAKENDGAATAIGDWVIEKYCSGESSPIEYYKCPHGCEDGACKLP
ncbi:MAG: hypothetical protein JSV92_01020 [archaeon]|nr:MAG: hypothetical protein JSV92_01020 [archaeon]